MKTPSTPENPNRSESTVPPGTDRPPLFFVPLLKEGRPESLVVSPVPAAATVSSIQVKRTTASELHHHLSLHEPCQQYSPSLNPYYMLFHGLSQLSKVGADLVQNRGVDGSTGANSRGKEAPSKYSS